MMRLLLIAIGVIALLIAPLLASWLQFVLTVAIAQGFAALGVAILLRAGLISIGHAMFYATGAYLTAFMTQKLGISDFAALLAMAVVGTGLAGALVGLFMVRYRAIFFAMLNLAVSMVLFALLAKLYNITGGTDGIRIAQPTVFGVRLSPAAFHQLLFYASIALMLAAGVVVHLYLKSPLGRALSAIHTNELRLEYLGVPVWLVLLISYVISAALAGLGGALAATAIGHVVPQFAYWTASGHLVLVAVLGGIGGVAGPFIGAVFLGIIHTYAVGYTADAWNLIVGAVLLLVIFFLPMGLYGLISGGQKSRW